MTPGEWHDEDTDTAEFVHWRGAWLLRRRPRAALCEVVDAWEKVARMYDFRALEA